MTYCHASSVSWVDAADVVQWTAALPKRMFDADIELCECRRVDDGGPCAAEAQLYLQNPREYSIGFALGTHQLGSTVITADETGVLALSKKDGAIVLDRACCTSTEQRRPLLDAGDLSMQAVGTFDGTPDPASKMPFNTRIKLGAEWLKLEGQIWM